MATDQGLNANYTHTQRLPSRQKVTLTVAGDTTVKDSTVVIPAGSWLRGITIETETAISGAPTHANVQVGLTDGGTEVVAAVDAQALGHIATTIVAALNKITSFAAADTTLFIECITTGGTAPAGPIQVLVDYDAPVR